MKVVHLTDKQFNLRHIEPDSDNGVCKPHQGLWFSPAETRTWEKWGEEYWPDELKKVNFEVVCDLDETNILKIDNLRDIEKLPFTKSIDISMPRVNWQKLKDSGVDAVYLTEKGYSEARRELLRDFKSHANCFYSWDTESIVVLNERCIKSCNIQQKKCELK